MFIVVYDWSFGTLMLTQEDPMFLLYSMVVVVANLAILHYVNGVQFVLLDDEEEKVKMD